MAVWLLEESEKLARKTLAATKAAIDVRTLTHESQICDVLESADDSYIQAVGAAARDVVQRGYAIFHSITTEAELAYTLGVATATSMARLSNEAMHSHIDSFADHFNRDLRHGKQAIPVGKAPAWMELQKGSDAVWIAGPSVPFRPLQVVVFGAEPSAVIKSIKTVDPIHGTHEQLGTQFAAGVFASKVPLAEFRTTMAKSGAAAARQVAGERPEMMMSTLTTISRLEVRTEGGDCEAVWVYGETPAGGVVTNSWDSKIPPVSSAHSRRAGYEIVGLDESSDIFSALNQLHLGVEAGDPKALDMSSARANAIRDSLLQKVMSGPKPRKIEHLRRMFWGCAGESENGFDWEFKFQFQNVCKVVGIALLNFDPSAVVTSIEIPGAQLVKAGLDISVQEFTPRSTFAQLLDRYFDMHAMLQRQGPRGPEELTTQDYMGMRDAFDDRTTLDPFTVGQQLVIKVMGSPFIGRMPHCDLLLSVLS